MTDPIIPPERIKDAAELLDLAESMTAGDIAQAGLMGTALVGSGGLAGIMLAFQDAAISDCQCPPCVTLREMARKFVGLD